MGLKLAMDDFGTGYSSIARMLDLPLDEVKIDMIFVKHMAIRHKHDRIVDSMINMAHRLNLSVLPKVWKILRLTGVCTR
ncbi:MAG: EAL domain-containing protein [Proteobacteria bacterium]|nr:EAL domain-containing protein [Pseudomonadota bacterium]